MNEEKPSEIISNKKDYKEFEKSEIENAIGDLIEKEMGKIGDKCGVLELGKEKYAVFSEDSGNKILKLLDMVFEETYALCCPDKEKLKKVEEVVNEIENEINEDNCKKWECPSCGTIIESEEQPVGCDCGRRGGFNKFFVDKHEL